MLKRQEKLGQTAVAVCQHKKRKNKVFSVHTKYKFFVSHKANAAILKRQEKLRPTASDDLQHEK